MKIISGKLKGRNILVPSIARPTLSRHRQRLFDILTGLLISKSNSSDSEETFSFANKIILDAFAGSGSFAIEAISRGAKQAYFVDNNLQAVNLTKQNIENLKIADQCCVFCKNVLHLKNITKDICDVVFIDPPYGKIVMSDIINSLEYNNWIDHNTIIILETDAKYAHDIKNIKLRILREQVMGNSYFIIGYMQ